MKVPVEIQDLATAVYEVFGVDVFEKTRRREIVDARMAIMVATRKMFTTTEIANSFSMDHSSVVHAVKQHKTKYNIDSRKRYRLYRAYCDIFDFCANRILEKNYTQYETISDVKDNLANEKQLRFELEQRVADLEAKLKGLTKQNAELLKYKSALRQMLIDQKIQDEKATKEG